MGPFFFFFSTNQAIVSVLCDACMVEELFSVIKPFNEISSEGIYLNLFESI